MSVEMEWSSYVDSIVNTYNVIAWPAASRSEVDSSMAILRIMDIDFRCFYLCANGINLEWFTIFPCISPPFAPSHSLRDVNDPSTTTYLGSDKDMLARFCVFASIGDGIAAYDRTDGSIWYEDGCELVQTNLSLRQFISVCIKDVIESRY